jgi:hypothetical protein
LHLVLACAFASTLITFASRKCVVVHATSMDRNLTCHRRCAPQCIVCVSTKPVRLYVFCSGGVFPCCKFRASADAAVLMADVKFHEDVSPVPLPLPLTYEQPQQTPYPTRRLMVASTSRHHASWQHAVANKYQAESIFTQTIWSGIVYLGTTSEHKPHVMQPSVCRCKSDQQLPIAISKIIQKTL